MAVRMERDWSASGGVDGEVGGSDCSGGRRDDDEELLWGLGGAQRVPWVQAMRTGGARGPMVVVGSHVKVTMMEQSSGAA